MEMSDLSKTQPNKFMCKGVEWTEKYSLRQEVLQPTHAKLSVFFFVTIMEMRAPPKQRRDTWILHFVGIYCRNTLYLYLIIARQKIARSMWNVYARKQAHADP